MIVPWNMLKVKACVCFFRKIHSCLAEVLSIFSLNCTTARVYSRLESKICEMLATRRVNARKRTYLNL